MIVRIISVVWEVDVSTLRGQDHLVRRMMEVCVRIVRMRNLPRTSVLRSAMITIL